jgi:hypothetical protein
MGRRVGPIGRALCAIALLVAVGCSGSDGDDQAGSSPSLDVDAADLGFGPQEEVCVVDGLEQAEADHPDVGSIDSAAVDRLSAAEHDALVDVVAEVLAACVDLGAVQERGTAVAMEQFNVPPEVAPCIARALDDEWYARNLADGLIHGGSADDTFIGQQQAAMLPCGRQMTEDLLRRAGASEEFLQCNLAAQDALARELERDPANWRELTNEAANTARSVACRRDLPASTPAGAIDYASAPATFTDAVAEELTAAAFGGPSEAQADCMAAALVDGIGRDDLAGASPTAAQVVELLVGARSAADLGVDMSREQAGSIADALTECVGPDVARLYTLNGGNILDALGRPKDPPELTELTHCAVDALDPAILRGFLVIQFLEGPDAYLTDAGDALIDDTFAVVADCADELGIAHSPPHE